MLFFDRIKSEIFNMNEQIANFISSIILGEVDFLEVKDDLYSYEGTLTKVDISLSSKPIKISFKALPKRSFWWPRNKQLDLDVQVGAYVRIKYTESIVKSYSHFWIKSIDVVDDIKETTYKRKYYKAEEKSPSIKCLNSECRNDLPISDFKQCEGIIEQTFWIRTPHCNQCYSISGDKYIGQRCIRETILCNGCNSPRKI